MSNLSEEEKIIIGKGTWIDKLASEMIEREKQLGRDTKLLKVESGLGASGIPHIGSLGDAVRAPARGQPIEPGRGLPSGGGAARVPVAGEPRA